MATIADELNAISVEHGYTGAAPKTIAGAIDALADTLAGTDVEERRTIAGAVKALAPYIGSGGGGTTLGPLQNEVLTLDMTSYEGTLIGTTTIPVGISGASIGNNAAFAFEPAIYGDSVTNFASGMTVTFSTSGEVTSVHVVTVDIEGNVVATAREWDGSFACVQEPYGAKFLTTLTMPELDAYEDGQLSPYGGEVLLLAPNLD